jgi:hypothetical protein
MFAMTSTSISGRNARVEKRGMIPILILLILAVGFGLPSAVVSQQVEIDVDRATAGVQATLSTDTGMVQGAVVATGVTDAGRYAIQLLMTNSGGGNAIVCTGTSAAADPGGVQDGAIGVTFVCNDASVPNSITRANLFSANATAVDGNVVLFNFDLELDCVEGETISIDFETSTNNSTLGVNIDGTARTFGSASSNPIPTVGGSVTCGPDDGDTLRRCADSGYVILDGLGGRHNVGLVTPISGPVYYGVDIAKDLEVARSGIGTVTDFIVLDQFGGATFVANAGDTPAQGFNFPDGTSPAVDVEIANDSAGFWVLRANGEIYAAGSALASGDGSTPVASTPVALDFPFGGAVPRNDNPLTPAGDPDASVRAVGFAVVQSGDPTAPTGIVVLDSQGGHYILTGSGANELDDDAAGSILNGPGGASETVYPFWQGLDIGRDIELHPAGGAADGVGIYDGWGGVHPVPVNVASSGVQFLRNEGDTASTVGLPYLVLGFDDPTTPENEGDTGTFGIDSQSIFKDLEFCSFTTGQVGAEKGTDSGGDGIYVLDGFGGVFALGGTRILGPDNPAPAFTGGPYFFPNPIVRDLEPVFELGR